MQLDRTDFELIRLLQEDARLSNKQLAAAVGLAQSTCHERLKRLWSTGVIQGARAEIDPGSLGFGIAAMFFIGTSQHEQDAIDTLLDEFIAIPEVQSVSLITGRYDLVAEVVARDMNHLKVLAHDNFTNRSVVTRFETSIVYEGRAARRLPVPSAEPV